MTRHIPDWEKFIKFNKKTTYTSEEGFSGKYEKGQIALASNVFLKNLGNVPQMLEDGAIEWCDKKGNPLKIKKQDKREKKTEKDKKLRVAKETINKKNISKSTKLFEPVLNDDNPKWLVIKEITRPPDKKEFELIAKGEELDWLKDKEYSLEEPDQWICKKCGFTFTFESEPHYCDGCNRNSSFERITKMINPDMWKLPIWKSLPQENLKMLELYDDTVKLIKQLLIFSDDIEYEIFTLWIFSTWKLECWDTVGYPIFIGLPNSGKSRALRIIAQLGYRAMKASGVKQAAIPRLCHYHNITLLIDEAHRKLNPHTESGSGLLDFVKDSYKRGSIYAVCDNDDQENVIITRNFGFKAIAGEKTFKTGLLSRGLLFWMEKGNPEIAKLTYVDDEFNKIRTRLLNYRYKTTNPEDLGNDFCLKGRTREIFESIVATGQHIGVDVTDIISYAQKRSERDDRALENTIQYEILASIKNSEENPRIDDAPFQVKTESILEEIGWLTGDGAEDNKKRQQFGYILRDIGIETKRTKDGRVIELQDEENSKRLKRLYERYKLC